jgi:predicted nucleic acid-binding protein
VELDDWVLNVLGARTWGTFAEDVKRGAYRLHHPEPSDLMRAAELEAAYASLDLGLVDASVVVACERLGETKVATLDRDFAVVRPRHCETLRILPE